MSRLHACIVCGWKGFGQKPVFPFSSHEICACCGTEFGLDVQEERDVQRVRQEWLAEGAPWFDDEDDVEPGKPECWDVSIAKSQIKNLRDS
ncbi:MAG: hypothetical protein K6L81_08150 [Agarilytica sp.]